MAEVRAEMVANVGQVVAAEGDHVDDGDILVILESMKMEIPVVAEGPGVVTKIHVAQGDVVQDGDLIAVVDDALSDLAPRRPGGQGCAGPKPGRKRSGRGASRCPVMSAIPPSQFASDLRCRSSTGGTRPRGP